MGRSAEGWKIRPHGEAGILHVRFRHEKRRHEISTGYRDFERATPRAAQIYAEVISGRWNRSLIQAAAPGAPLEELVGDWLAATVGDVGEDTWKLRKIHMRAHLIPFFDSLDRVTEQRIGDYRRARLREILRVTLVKELGTLRRFLEWCEAEKYLAKSPVVEMPAKNIVGTESAKGKHKRKAIHISPAEAQSIALRLPETTRARRGHVRVAVRDFFVVLWETGLRPATVQRIETPVHYRRGAGELAITEVIDKVRYARTVPLTDAAREALDRWAPGAGLVFGRHDFRVPLERACTAAAEAGELPAWKAEAVSSYDFRHGRITELVSTTGTSLAGVAYLVGHRQVTTTNRYVQAPRSAADAALRAAISGGIRGAPVAVTGALPQKPRCEGGDLNPYGSNPASTSRQRKAAR